MNTRQKTLIATALGLLCGVDGIQAQTGWARKASMPEQRPFPHESPVSANGRIYCLDGANRRVMEYDTASDRWTRKKSSMPTARHHFGVAVANGKIYYVGGCSSPRGEKEQHTRLGVVEEYDPTADAWRGCRGMPTPRMGMAVAAWNGKIYAIGGLDEPKTIRAVEVYDPATDTWARKNDWSRSNYLSLNSATLGNKIYLVGCDRLEAYDPLADTFESKKPRPGGWRQGFSMTGAEGRLYAYGGVGEKVNEFEVYDPAGDSWSLLPPSPKPAKAFVGMASVGSRVFLLGGHLGTWDNQDDSVYEFNAGEGNLTATPGCPFGCRKGAGAL